VTVDVSFLNGEQPVVATRRGRGVEAAVERLLAGPTAAETKRGVRSQLPAGVPVKSLTVEHGVASIDLGAKFASVTSAESLPARFAQLVLTLTAVPGVEAVKVRVNGDVRQQLYPGLDLRRPVTAAMLAKPKGKPAVAKTKKGPAPKASMLELEKRLVALGFLDKAQADGRANQATFNAAIAFQKWAGIGRDGKIGPITRKALEAATRPTPRRQGAEGKRVEVLLDRQLLLLIWGNTVVRVLHISSGRPGYDTPTGRFAVTRKFTKDWSVPYAVWLPWASYFVGGVAFHESPDVPATAASHGCVRVPHGDAEWLYRRIPVGTPVAVVSKSR
jgi:lipoprotein-anchoring transpeptidase ErfK/SrfK